MAGEGEPSENENRLRIQYRFSRGATPEHGNAIYLQFIESLRQKGIVVETGQFGAEMKVALVNDGPATFQFQV